MTTAAIKIPFQITLHTGSAGTWSAPSWTNLNTYTPTGWLLPGSGTTIYAYSIALPVPIPADINPIPHAKVIVFWSTKSTYQVISDRVAMVKVSLSGVGDQGQLNPVAPETTLDPFKQANDGAGLNYEVEQSIDDSALSLDPGNSIFGKILRDPDDPVNTLEDDIFLRQVLFVADDTATP